MYCIIDTVDDCIVSKVEMIDRMQGLVALTNGRFKLLLSGIGFLGLASESNQCWDIALELRNRGIEEQYVRDRIRKLALENPAWYGLEDIAVGQLDTISAESPFLLLKLNMLLLEWTSRHSTRKGLKQKLRQQPTTLRGYYTQVMDNIDDANRNVVIVALRWIVYAIRPL